MTEISRPIYVLLLPAVQLLDCAGPSQVFHEASLQGAGYQLQFCGIDSSVVSAQGLVLQTQSGLATLQPEATILIPGVQLDAYANQAQPIDPAIIHWLQTAATLGCRIAAICSGAFVLGEAGLLDQRACTTHWSAIELLQQRYPKANVRANVLYIQAGQIITSAGISTGIDLALALVEQDYGSLIVAKIARQLVLYLRRSGQQAQHSIYVQYRNHLHLGVHRAQDYLAEHVSDAISLEQLAEIAKLSVRSLNRAFRASIGLTPIGYQQQLRLELAATLLNNPAWSIEQVAQEVGFSDARHFRRLWQRNFGTTPTQHRHHQEPVSC